MLSVVEMSQGFLLGVGVIGGEGVGWGGRYLWYIPSPEKAKMN